ncbi:MAG: hypothetical protein DCC67_12060 [Planctomycetota bacterium]|nr:MAG: hypothetical protein DCC67_12060 [Planctomycetota bacterium]
MVRVSPLRRLAGHRRVFQAALLVVLAAWALPSLAQDAAIGSNAEADQVAPASADVQGVTWEGIRKAAIVIAVFVVPMFVGSFLAKRLRMPDYGWKFALALGSLGAAAVIIGMGEIKLGPDLSGGITLIYEVENPGAVQPEAGADGQAAGDEPASEDAEAAGQDAPVDAEEDQAARPGMAGASADERMAALIKALTERVDPSGTKEVSIKKFGDGQIEIIIPKADEQELAAIERRIYTAGVLEFRITASPRFAKHQAAIQRARELPPGQNIVRMNNREVARWVEYDQKQFGTPDRAEAMGLVVRVVGDRPQALVMTDDDLNVTGEYLRSAAPSTDEMGRPAVSFVFNAQGAFRFRQLTAAHQPNPSGEKYNLGILLDNRLLSAPLLNAVISDQGIIEGLDSEEEVTFLVGILNAGSLPASLNKTPISRAQISPTLGQLTVERGKRALTISLVLVAAFMVFYYKWAGIISWLGLASNMLLILGCMVLIKAAFTLPGLAGLVLTVGMSVDANVLIYERIREELKRGAALRMAIRNGFNRASTTIIDSNVTNLITGIVIYKIAPDSVKGFGITLVLGIAMSVYTAVFLTRLVFDVAERRRWLTKMSMRHFIPETRFDFLGWRHVWITASLAVIGVGLAFTFLRGRDMLDIDFTGGSSITMVLKERTPYAEVFETLQGSPLRDQNLSLVAVGDSQTRYTVTTINDDVVAVEGMIAKALGDKLQTYRVDVENVQPIPGPAPAGATSWLEPRRTHWLAAGLSPISYVALLQEQPGTSDTETAAADDEAAAPPAEGGASEPPAQPPTTSDGSAASGVEATVNPPSTEAAPDNAGSPPPAESPAGSTGPSEMTGAEEAETGDAFAGGTSARIKFAVAGESGESSGVSFDTLSHLLQDALKAAGHADASFELSNPDYREGSIRSYEDWNVKLPLPESEARQVFDLLQASTNQKPVFPLSNKIGGRVAGRMAADATAAIVLCLIGIIGYVWFRFHGLFYGIAAVVALIHDVLVTLGFVALSSYVVEAVPPLASALMIDKFQINLVLVAAFLTIIGYSLNDTIVIFDRIREIKGKSPRLTRDMVNLAVNQTLARTILTSFTTLVSTVVLYIFGGEGIHAFAFALLVGFVAGCYSTIFIANPVLMWLMERFEGRPAPAKAAVPTAPARA